MTRFGYSRAGYSATFGVMTAAALVIGYLHMEILTNGGYFSDSLERPLSIARIVVPLGVWYVGLAIWRFSRLGVLIVGGSHVEVVAVGGVERFDIADISRVEILQSANSSKLQLHLKNMKRLSIPSWKIVGFEELAEQFQSLMKEGRGHSLPSRN
jgi:hypothetical protein